MDYLGTKAVIPYAAHGFGMYVSLSTMDKWWHEGMSKEKGVELMRKSIDEVTKRESRVPSVNGEAMLTMRRAGIVVKFNFNCILIDKNGLHHIDLLSSDPLAEVTKASEASATATAPVDPPNPTVATAA